MILDPIQLLSSTFWILILYIYIFCENAIYFLFLLILYNFVRSGISSESDRIIKSSGDASLIPFIKNFFDVVL